MAPLAKKLSRDGAGRAAMQTMTRQLKIPKSVYFSATMLMESVKRLSAPPTKEKSRFVFHPDFLDALDYNRIVARAEGRDESAVDAWADLFEKKTADHDKEEEKAK